MSEGTNPQTSGQPPQTSGALKTKISLKSGQVVHPFHTFKPDLPPASRIQANYDLLTAYNLGPVDGFTGPRRIPEDISAFLPHICGKFNFDVNPEMSSLRALVEKPPIHKEITNLPSSAMQGFRLNSGPVDEKYRTLFERRKNDDVLFYNEKTDMLRVKKPYDPYEEHDETEEGFPRKHKKKKKDKKKKKNKEPKFNEFETGGPMRTEEDQKKKKDKKDRDDKKHQSSSQMEF